MTRPMRILHLTAASDAGGLSRYIFDLCSAMHAQGHQLTVAGQHGVWHWLFEKAPFPWIDVPLKGGPLALASARRRLLNHLQSHPIDLIHTHYRRTTLVARAIQKRLQIPILFTLHQPRISLAWPRRLFSDFGDRTHVASADSRLWLIDDAHLPPDRIALIPHGIDPARFPRVNPTTRREARASLHLPDSALVAAFVGRFDVPKNSDWILDLAESAPTHLPDLHIVMIGEGPEEPLLRRRIDASGLQHRVQLLSHRDPLPVYHAADALLVPSLREGFSLVTLEAMSTGIPVLRTRTGGAAELILENITGRSVPIDRDQFIQGALDFLQDRAALLRMGAAAADHIRQHFTFQRQLDQTLDLYRSLADSSPPPR